MAMIYKQPSVPRLFDRPIQNLQDALGGLSWMDNVYGRCERLVKEKDGRRTYTPNAYKGNGDYILLTPDEVAHGNYCFFVMEEPETVGVSMGVQSRIRAPFSLIVWVDMRKVGHEADDRNIYQVEAEVLECIGVGGVLKSGSIQVSKVYHHAENVFQGFSLDEVDNQFMMSPFAGFRITGELIITEDCLNVT